MGTDSSLRFRRSFLSEDSQLLGGKKKHAWNGNEERSESIRLMVEPNECVAKKLKADFDCPKR